MTVLAFSETLRRMCGVSEGENPLMVSPLVAAMVEERRWTDRFGAVLCNVGKEQEE